MAGIIQRIYRVVPAVRKHIVPQEALAGAGVAVSVEESAEGGVVISGLQVIEARFGVVVVTAVAQGVDGCQAAGGGQGAAVGVVGVAGHCGTGGIDQMDDVALQVQNIVVGRGNRCAACGRGQIQQVRTSVRIVEEVQGIGRAALREALPQELPRGVGVVMPNAVHNISVARHFEGACDREIRTFPAKGDGFLTSFEMTGEASEQITL